LPGVSSDTEAGETMTPHVVMEGVEKETGIQVSGTSQTSVRNSFIPSLRDLEIACSKTLSIDVGGASVKSDQFELAAHKVIRDSSK
jgi:hypothetical protein